MRYETGKVWKNSRELYFARKSFSINLNIRLTMNINVYKDLYICTGDILLFIQYPCLISFGKGERERERERDN